MLAERSLQSLHHVMPCHQRFKSNWKRKEKLPTWSQSLTCQHMRHTLWKAILNCTFTVKIYVNLLIPWTDVQFLGVAFPFSFCLEGDLYLVLKVTHLIMHWPRIFFCFTFGFNFLCLAAHLCDLFRNVVPVPYCLNWHRSHVASQHCKMPEKWACKIVAELKDISHSHLVVACRFRWVWFRWGYTNSETTWQCSNDASTKDKNNPCMCGTRQAWH